jgi:hypothetical protein
MAVGVEGGSDCEERKSDSETQEEYLAHLEAALGESEQLDADRLPKRHYFVPGNEGDDGWGEEIGFNENSENPDSIDRHLVLPQEDLPVHVPLPATSEPRIDYNRSHILTSDKFVASLEANATQKQALLEEAEMQRLLVEENKEVHMLQKLDREK